jgi:hypothetical protein
MSDVCEYTLELPPELAVCESERSDPGDAMELVNDGDLLQRIEKVCLFLVRPVIASPMEKGSDATELMLDATASLIRLS